MENTVETEEIQGNELEQATQELEEANQELKEAEDELQEATGEPGRTYDEEFINKLQEKVQKRIDKQTAKMYQYKERAEKAEKRLQELNTNLEPRIPNLGDFVDEYGEHDYEAYNKSMKKYMDERDLWKNRNEELRQYSKNEEMEKIDKVQRFYDLSEIVREKYEDFDEVVEKNVFSEEVRDILLDYDDETGAELAYYLGKNSTQAIKLAEIGKTNPLKLEREIGKLETRIKSLANSTSNALPPITPVDDSRTIDYGGKLSDEEYFKKERKKLLEQQKLKYS